ncbi:MAG: choice-of-anchor D domain-containing protein [Nocardioidaceae bacterium]|nr:choice-of-anchor D domain-containing protein [Nocardioidaceae bacterium]
MTVQTKLRFSHLTHARRLAAALLVGAVSVAGLSLLGEPAQANLAAPPGPLDANGFPSTYTDSEGLSLQLCLDGPPLCPGTEADLVGNGADGSGFYSRATAQAGPVEMTLALRAGYAGAGDAQQTTVARSQYVAPAGSLQPHEAYQVTDPYGSAVCTSDADGGLTADACRTDSGGTAQDFTAAQDGRIGPFLTWDTLGAEAGAPPASYVGDGATPHAVTGSPDGFNRFRVQGPGIDGTCEAATIPSCAETDQFVVAGKIAPGPAASAKGDGGWGAQWWLSTREVTYTSIGEPGTSVRLAGFSVTGSNAFSIVPGGTCRTGALLPTGTRCTVMVEFRPGFGPDATGQLVFADDAPGGTRAVDLSGTKGVSAFGAEPFDFGDVGVGHRATHVVTVTNNGSAPLNLSVMDFAPASKDFDVVGTGDYPCIQGVTALLPGDSCTGIVTFTPTRNGPRHATLALTAMDRKTPTTVDLSGGGLDVTKPTVRSRTPGVRATGVGRTRNVVVAFSEAVRGVRGATFRLERASTGRAVGAVVTGSGSRWVLNPRATLPARTWFRVRLVGGSTNVRDLSGLPLTSTSWTFRTR